jgi:hypothetical protein
MARKKKQPPPKEKFTLEFEGREYEGTYIEERGVVTVWSAEYGGPKSTHTTPGYPLHVACLLLRELLQGAKEAGKLKK